MYESSFPWTNAVAREGGRRRGGVDVEGRLLVRVLAVAERGRAREGERQPLGKRLARLGREPAGDRGVVRRGAPEDLRGEAPARPVASGRRRAPAARRRRPGSRPGRRRRRRARGFSPPRAAATARRRRSSRWPRRRSPGLRHGFLEGIEIHDDEVDGRDSVRGGLADGRGPRSGRTGCRRRASDEASSRGRRRPPGNP